MEFLSEGESNSALTAPSYQNRSHFEIILIPECKEQIQPNK